MTIFFHARDLKLFKKNPFDKTMFLIVFFYWATFTFLKSYHFTRKINFQQSAKLFELKKLPL